MPALIIPGAKETHRSQFVCFRDGNDNRYSPDISQLSTGKHPSPTQRVSHEWIAVFKRRGTL